ncbi:MAG: DUF6010 family protein [Rhodothermales bacterium]
MDMTWGFWLVLGFVLGAAFLVFARRRGAQRKRRLLAVGLVVAALIYVGFAVAWADAAWMMIELGGVLVFTGLAVLGLKRSALWLAVGWALHPAWDVGLHLVGAGAAFAPAWYAVACISFDLLVATYVIARFRRTPVAPQTV